MRSSHTPSQFHSPGLLARLVDGSGEVVRLCAADAMLLKDLYAWYAPGLAAAASGMESRSSSLLNAFRMYSSTSYIVTSIIGREDVEPVARAALSEAGDLVDSREALRSRPNH